MIDRDDIDDAVYEVLNTTSGKQAAELGGDALYWFNRGVMMLGTNLLDRLGER